VSKERKKKQRFREPFNGLTHLVGGLIAPVARRKRRPFYRETAPSSAPTGWSKHTIPEGRCSAPFASEAS
jgi:hypothetical protein